MAKATIREAIEWRRSKTARLWATVCEVEPGLFQAVYSNTGTAADMNKLPQYQASSCASQAKRAFEQDAVTPGFGHIIWIDVAVAGPSLPGAGEASPNPPPIAVALFPPQ
jgi:hypothetical protein